MSLMSEFSQTRKEYIANTPKPPAPISITLKNGDGEIVVCPKNENECALELNFRNIDIMEDNNIILDFSDIERIIEWFNSPVKKVKVSPYLGYCHSGHFSPPVDGQYLFTYNPWSNSKLFEFYISQKSMKKFVNYLRKLYM